MNNKFNPSQYSDIYSEDPKIPGTLKSPSNFTTPGSALMVMRRQPSYPYWMANGKIGDDLENHYFKKLYVSECAIGRDIVNFVPNAEIYIYNTTYRNCVDHTNSAQFTTFQSEQAFMQHVTQAKLNANQR